MKKAVKKLRRIRSILNNAMRLRTIGVEMGELPHTACGEILLKFKVKTYSGNEVVKYRLWGCGEYNCPLCDYYKSEQAGLKIWRLVEARLKNKKCKGFLRIILTFPQSIRERLWDLLNNDKKSFQKILSKCISRFYNSLREVDKHNHRRVGDGFYVFHYIGDSYNFHPHYELWLELPDRFPPINRRFIDRLRALWKGILERVFDVEIDKVDLQVRYFLGLKRSLKKAVLYSNRSMMVKEDMDLSDTEKLKNVFILKRLTKGMRRRVGFGIYRSYIKNLDTVPEILDDGIDWKTRKLIGLYHILKLYIRNGVPLVEIKNTKTNEIESILFEDVEWHPLKE
jgi:hypothetical protein